LKLNGGQKRSGGSDGSKHPLLRPERSLHREIGNRIGGDDVPTLGISRSKERPLVQEERSEGRWEEERTSGRGGGDGHPFTCSFDRKDLSIERSGTVSVATTSPHTEFPDRRSGRLIRRSGDGGGGHHGRSVMDFSFCDGDFSFTRGEEEERGRRRRSVQIQKACLLLREAPIF
jgi:hypothetical protein